MTGHDRTAEFIATARSKKTKPQYIQQLRTSQNGLTDNQKINKLALDPHYREFMRQSQDCAKRISASYDKLQRLTVLAKKRTVFDDGELNRLVAEIRSDISESKNLLEQLQASHGPKQKHSESIVSTMQQRLATITSNFKSTLEVRSRSVQQQTARHEMFAGPSTTSNAMVPSTSTALNNYQTGHPSLLNSNQLSDSYSNNSHSMDLSGVQQQQLQQFRPQMQQQLLLDDQTDLSDRADKMHMIESTIVELGTVFNQLAQMVQDQGETITRIDMNISETTGNVESAHDALLSFFASVNSHRWLMLKVFGVLFFFFIIFVMFAT